MNMRSALDENSLLNEAKENTGVDDFGRREPFQRLVKSLDEDAQLNLMGRLMMWSDLLIFLEARLRVEGHLQGASGDRGRADRPTLFIIGQERTGTTVLQNLLAADPANGTERYGECMFACPAAREGHIRDRSPDRGGGPVDDQYSRVAPELETMNEKPTSPLGPEG